MHFNCFNYQDKVLANHELKHEQNKVNPVLNLGSACKISAVNLCMCHQDKLETSDRLAAMEEDYNKVSADYNDMMSRFDREQLMTGNVSTCLP